MATILWILGEGGGNVSVPDHGTTARDNLTNQTRKIFTFFWIAIHTIQIFLRQKSEK